MEKDLRKIWRVLRSTLLQECTFEGIKELVAESGLPVEELTQLQQRSSSPKKRGASKSELFDAVDDLIKNEREPTAAIQNLIATFLKMYPDHNDKVEECIRKFAWTIIDGQMRPSDFQVEAAVVDSAEEVRQSLHTAYARYDQGDYPGAMTAVCSALDTLTLRVYEERGLGDAHKASYQDRACRSFYNFEEAYRTRLTEAQIDEQEISLIWKNYKGAVRQAAYVLGSFRRNASDVHGLSQCPPELVRYAIDCGTFIIRSITSEMNRDAQQLEYGESFFYKS